MKVVDWIYYDDEKYEDTKDYGEYKKAYKAIVEDVRANGYHFDGNYHQYGDYGCPLLDTGKKVCMTQRSWGKVIADAFPEEFEDPNDEYNYVEWYLGPTYCDSEGHTKYDDSKCKYPKGDDNGRVVCV